MGIVIGRVDSLGRGIGRRAIALAVPMARKVLGFDTVRLHVRKSNSRAISCYLNCGFAATGEGAKLLEDRGKVPFFRMELYLKPAASRTAASLDRTHEPVSMQRSAG
jgi:ribosomal protein S18 acetylase RimI-like enzyme